MERLAHSGGMPFGKSHQKASTLVTKWPLKHLERGVGTQYTSIEARLLTSHKDN
jgi:hypothetical protein